LGCEAPRLGRHFQIAWAVLSAIWNIGNVVAITRSAVPGSVPDLRSLSPG